MNIIDRITKLKLTCDVGTRHFHCGHEYVEIGGMKWATMNIGANSITDYGLFFQWGDTKGHTAEQVGSDEGKKAFKWADYKYCNGTNRIMSKFSKYNALDEKVILEPSDDAVTAAWGGNWRMPTTEEFQTLGMAANAVWTTDYQGSGVVGLVCTDKTDSSKVLFFPASGFASNGSVRNVGSDSLYWSSSRSGSVSYAYELYFNSGGVHLDTSFSRCFGCHLRGVAN